jgi:dTDP-4-dehydrorhamnose reductase
MKILVTGAKGQLGFDVVKELRKRNIECLGVDIDDFDITDRDKSISFIKDYRPNLVIHCAGYTLVDSAEENKDTCMEVNYVGTKHIVLGCKSINAKLIYISTDYIFDGKKELSYEINDEPNPSNVYGLSKLLGENLIREELENYYIIRVSWMFGPSKNNFVETMIRLGNEKNKINVVDNQIGSPTYTADVASLIIEIGLSDKYGIYHATNDGFCSWAEFAKEIMKQANLKCEINPINSNKYKSKVLRPENSRLSKKSLLDNGFSLLPTWQDALGRYLNSRSWGVF